MASLLLITGALLLAVPNVKEVRLTIEPSSDVTRGTDVMLRCRAVIDSGESLSRVYTIYKDSAPVYTKTTSSDDFLQTLTEVQISDKGRYWCEVDVQGEQETSEVTNLVVRGATPQLHLDNVEVTEGEELTARCTAPGETGHFTFYLYDNSKDVLVKNVDTNEAEFNYRLRTAGNHTIHCSYDVIVRGASTNSRESNKVALLVTELDIRPVLEINPRDEIYEGDQLNLTCTFVTTRSHVDTVVLNLWHKSRAVSYGDHRIDYSMNVTAEDSGEFMCRLIMGRTRKSAKKLVSVTERIEREDLTYSLDPAPGSMRERDVGVFHGSAPKIAFNYTCVAAARNVAKSSVPLTIRPKVHVSIPKISLVERAVLGRPFKILCRSDSGSLPINYTLHKAFLPVDHFTVRLPDQQAVFTVTVSSPEEMKQFLCEAQNSQRLNHLSKKLDATLIVPLSHPTLTVIPVESEISEDDDLYLICGVKGSPPVTFKWYLVGIDEPIGNITSDKNTSHYQIKALRTGHSGTYICEAMNYANVVRSAPVVINVRMALWKKASIGGAVALVAVALIAVAVGYFRKPSSPNSDDTLAESFSLNTEVHNADPASAVESRAMTAEPDVEYTEVVHPRPKDPARAPTTPLRKGTDTVYSELQNSPHSAGDLQGYGSVEYVELSRSDRPASLSFRSDVNSAQDLPVPVD
ncbi:platelet endothelial cell adhesion molecule [Neosynchiropus ocellatus]